MADQSNRANDAGSLISPSDPDQAKTSATSSLPNNFIPGGRVNQTWAHMTGWPPSYDVNSLQLLDVYHQNLLQRLVLPAVAAASTAVAVALTKNHPSQRHLSRPSASSGAEEAGKRKLPRRHRKRKRKRCRRKAQQQPDGEIKLTIEPSTRLDSNMG